MDQVTLGGVDTQAGRYRGVDRRRPQGWAPPPVGWAFCCAASLLVSVAILVALQVVTGPPPAGDPEQVELLLAACGAAVAVIAGGLAITRGALTGTARSLLVGWGMVVLGSVAFGLGEIIPAIFHIESDWTVAVSTGGRLTAIAFFVWGATSPEVDSGLRAARLPLVAAGAAAAASAGVHLLISVPTPSVGLFDEWPLVVAAVAWGGLAALYLRRGRASWTESWCGLAFVGFALGGIVRVMLEADLRPLAGVDTVKLAAAGIAVVGITWDLHLDLRWHREELGRSRARGEVAHRRARLVEDEAGQHTHEVRNALTAIGGAARTLERHRHRLSADDIASLWGAVSREVARLQQVLDRPRAPADDSLMTTIDHVVEELGMHGLEVEVEVEVEVDVGLAGRGAHDLGDALRHLIRGALWHAHGETVRVTGTVLADRTELFIALSEAQVPRRWNRDLQLASELLTELGGQLVAGRRDRASGFVVRLPSDATLVPGPTSFPPHPQVDAPRRR